LQYFENIKIRRVYDEESEAWYFSVVDIIQVLTHFLFQTHVENHAQHCFEGFFAFPEYGYSVTFSCSVRLDAELVYL